MSLVPLRAPLLLLLLLLAVPPCAAQHRGRPVGPADTVLRTVAEAEAHGRRHPVLPDTVRQTRFRTMSGPGSADRRCVLAGAEPGLPVDYAGVRAGDFQIGPFLDDGRGAGYGKMWFMPAVPQRFGQPKVPLVVRAVRTDGVAEAPRVFEYPELDALGQPSGDWFYATGLTLPSAGTWLMVVTAGPNWGCLVFRMGYPVEQRWSIDTMRRGS